MHNQHNAIDSPKSVSAVSGNLNGEIDLIWEPVEGAKNYIIQKSSGKNRWIHEDITSRSGCTVSKLKSGHKYIFRIAAVGPNGQSYWSETVEKKAP